MTGKRLAEAVVVEGGEVSGTPAAKSRSPWLWIPTLYFGQGIPYVVVMTLSVIMYKNLGVSNTDIALYTSWLYLPWVIKPLWSPLVDMFKTKRYWITTLQFVIGVSLAMVALTIPTSHFFQITLAVFWLMAFSSATHDIAADGFYMLALKQHQQAAFVGVRSTFYRIAMIAGQGALVYLAGQLSETTGSMTMAWSIVFWVLAGMFLLLFFYHRVVLPQPVSDVTVKVANNPVADFLVTFKEFFTKPEILLILAFLLTFRLGEAQALKLIAPFFLDPIDKGGLGLTTKDVGLIYGTYGVLALTIGGLIGGFTISRGGLKAWIWPMLFAVHIPNLAFVYLAYTQPTSHIIITLAIIIEQIGYGFGFAAYLLFMIMVADGKFKTAHYAICTGFMALGMMLPGMVSGWIQTQLGYQHFFICVCSCTLPSIAVMFFLKSDPAFGKKAEEV
ncbi:MAG: AmpG family muropeptide MFS transporter, partial [Rhodocyclaceae bacterium]|nr:AmpG family muropeptide MFS transporter [Rhodocyclaceae bacterium]